MDLVLSKYPQPAGFADVCVPQSELYDGIQDHILLRVETV